MRILYTLKEVGYCEVMVIVKLWLWLLHDNSGSVIVISDDDDYVGEVEEKADGEISSEIHMVSSFSSYISKV